MVSLFACFFFIGAVDRGCELQLIIADLMQIDRVTISARDVVAFVAQRRNKQIIIMICWPLLLLLLFVYCQWTICLSVADRQMRIGGHSGVNLHVRHNMAGMENVRECSKR